MTPIARRLLHALAPHAGRPVHRLAFTAALRDVEALAAARELVLLGFAIREEPGQPLGLGTPLWLSDAGRAAQLDNAA